jgi:hypothetical protein
MITFKNKYNFWVFYRWINALSFFFAVFKQMLYSDILLFIITSTTYIIKISIHLCCKGFFFVF